MKTLALLLSYLRPAVIIGTLPNTISNGQVEDATPLMANFNWIVNQVNAAGIAVTSLTPQLASANTYTALQSGINATALANFPTATQVINSSLTYCGTSTGTNTIAASAAINPVAYAVGQMFSFFAGGANTGAATLNLNSIGAAAIINKNGTALVAGQIPINSLVQVQYDGTNFELLGPSGFATFTGPTVARSYALPDANATVLTTNAAVTVAQGGLGVATLAAHGLLIGNGTGAVAVSGAGTAGQVMTSNGPAADPTFQSVVSAGLIPIATITPSAVAALNSLTAFSSTYNNYLIIGEGITLATSNSTLWMQLAVAGVLDTGSNYYQGATFSNTAVSATSTNMTVGGTVGQSKKGINFYIKVMNVNDATNIKSVFFEANWENATANNFQTTYAGATYTAANAVTGFGLLWNTGNNFGATGKIHIFGYPNS